MSSKIADNALGLSILASPQVYSLELQAYLHIDYGELQRCS